MLEKAESPLAVSLYDRINDAAFCPSYSFVAELFRGKGAQMIRNIFKRFTNQTLRLSRQVSGTPRLQGMFYMLASVDRECQKVICEPLGRNYRVSMPLIAFRPEKHEASRRCGMSLLMTSQPIVINRDLACRIGLNEAMCCSSFITG